MANQDWRSDLRPPQLSDIHSIGRRSLCFWVKPQSRCSLRLRSRLRDFPLRMVTKRRWRRGQPVSTVFFTLFVIKVVLCPNRDLFQNRSSEKSSQRRPTPTSHPGGTQFKSQPSTNLSVHMHPAFTPVLAADKKQANHSFFITTLLATLLAWKCPFQSCKTVGWFQFKPRT